jgi:hypothetical protein
MRRAWIAIAALAIVSAGGVSAGASTPGGPPADQQVSAVAFNHLHGLFCDFRNTDFCKAPTRVKIFGKWLERSGCPDLVGLQEINARLNELLTELVTKVCDGEYKVSFEPTNNTDAQMVLTRLEIIEEGTLDIASFPWEARWVRVQSPQGPVDFLTAHFASSSNNPPCTAELCPPICAAGIETNECHAHEVVEFLSGRSGAAMSIVAGDLNATRGEPTLDVLIGGGYVDSWLESGRDECDPETGRGCTGCSERKSKYIGMETKKGLKCDHRIDFVLARPGDGCNLSVAEANGFAHRPLKKAVNGFYWPSDHKGSQAAFTC